ncbi:hypothetical protein U6J60_12515, partial [Cutibacterium acnes]
HGFVAPSINIEQLDPAAEGLDIVTAPREQALTRVMSNSFGIGDRKISRLIRPSFSRFAEQFCHQTRAIIVESR